MERDEKYFDLRIIDNILTEITHDTQQFKLFIFDHTSLKHVKEICDNDFQNGIYFLRKNSSNQDLYIGQTTDGIDRLYRHHQIEKGNNKDYKVFFFDLDRDRANKNILEEIEREMIVEIGYDKLLNKTKGNNTPINNKDKKYAKHVTEIIRDFMLLFDFNLKKNNDNDLFFNEETHSISIREKGDVLKAAYDFISSDDEWKTWEEINQYVSIVFKNDLKNKRWKNESGLHAALRRDLQITSNGYEISVPEKQLFITRKNERTNKVNAFKIKQKEVVQ